MHNHNVFRTLLSPQKNNPIPSLAPHPLPKQLLTYFLCLCFSILDFHMNGVT